MRQNAFLLLVGIVLIFLSSCTIEKRLYSPGYHVEWKKHHRITNQNELPNVRMEDKSSSEYGVRNSELVEEKNVTGYKLEVALEPETNSPNLESRNLGT